MDRRSFARCCVGSALCGPAIGGWAAAVDDYPGARLVDATGSRLTVADVPDDEAMVFAYPYAGVPCYLVKLREPASPVLDLHSPDEGDYRSPAGVGPRGEFVAFVAICTHQLSYPTPQVSPLRYAAEGSALAGGQAGLIVCCAHGSVFDPAAGGQLVSGPAPGPLLPVRLEYDAAGGGLTATGTIADRLLSRFLDAYKGELIERYGPGAYRRPVGATTEAQRLSSYTRKVIAC